MDNSQRSVVERERFLLASYAMHSADSRGRMHPEAEHPYRGVFQRDRDRVVHSAAYRRLSAKTQVFTGELGDYHRTRLTHTHEVASVARTLGRALALNEDLIETLALLHDLGHPPFGHSGEDVLDACLKSVGGFSHNEQALRVVELLEVRYPEFSGLNLSLEVLAGQRHRTEKHRTDRPRPLLEVQVVDAADSVAYDTHDADDALELGLLKLDDLLEMTLWCEAAKRVNRRYADLRDGDLRRAVLHELIDWQVGDLLDRSRRSIEAHSIMSVDDVHRAPTIVSTSNEFAKQKLELEAFLYERVYRHPDVLRHRTAAQGFLQEMFALFVRQPELIPKRFHQRIGSVGLERSVGDYLAGMTDRFAKREFERLCGQYTP